MHRAARFIGRLWRSTRITMDTLQSLTSRIPTGLPADTGAEASLDTPAAAVATDADAAASVHEGEEVDQPQ